MQVYLLFLENVSGETLLLRTFAESSENAIENATAHNPGWIPIKCKLSHGGSRPGAGRISKWGEGVETHRYRLPKTFGDKASEIMDTLEGIHAILETWESKISESASRSASGQPAERYKYVSQLCSELRNELQSLPESFIC